MLNGGVLELNREYMVMILIVMGMVLSLLISVRKKNIKKAFLAGLIAQSITWPVGLLIVALGKVEYPVRLFPKAIDSSFLNGYIVNPAIFAIYYIHYPRQVKLIWRWAYTILITAISISSEIIQNKFTNLIKYNNWSPFYTWMIAIASYFIMRKYLDWFFKNA
jgi:membrane-associated PAP2 superfamily phosphatase